METADARSKRAQAYRRKAAQCKEAADKATSEADRDAWMSMATEWLRCAVTVQKIDRLTQHNSSDQKHQMTAAEERSKHAKDCDA
jgi:hypothetical protein